MENAATDAITPDFPKPGHAKGGVRQRLLRGLGSTALNPVVTAIIQLGTVPLLLRYWGAAKYGDWLILSALPSYLSLANLGFGDASGSDMTVRVVREDRKGAIETFQSSFAILTAVSIIALLVVSVSVWWVPWHSWIHLSSLSDHQAALVILILASYIIVGQQGNVIESGYRCDGNFAAGTFWATMMRLAETVIATIVGIRTGSLIDSALAFLLSRSVTTFCYGLMLRRKSPWLLFGLRYASFGRINQLVAPACGFMALPLGSAIGIQGFTILIGILSGPVAVTTFATLRTLARVNFQLTTAIGSALWPELSTAFGTGNIGLARRLHRRAYQAGLLLSVSAGTFLWVAGPYIYRSWIRNAVGFDSLCFHILLVVTFANSMWFTSSVVPMSTNAHHRLTITFLAASALSLAVGAVLIPPLGISGAACALLLTDLVMVSVVLRTSLTQLHETFAEFAAAVFRPPSRWRTAN